MAVGLSRVAEREIDLAIAPDLLTRGPDGEKKSMSRSSSSCAMHVPPSQSWLSRLLAHVHLRPCGFDENNNCSMDLVVMWHDVLRLHVRCRTGESRLKRTMVVPI